MTIKTIKIMSTSATIVIKVRKEDVCKIKTAQSNFAKMHFKDFNCVIKEYGKEIATDYFNRGIVKLPDINKFQCRVKRVKLGQYLEIYCHFDGYVDGVGRCLIENFETYEKALNLVLCGDHSSIINGTIPYIALWETKWDWFKPKKYNSVPEVTENYQYLFKSNEWYYRDFWDKTWRLVRDYIK